MANPFKGSWPVIILIAAGIGILGLSVKSKQDSTHAVVLQEIFKQTPSVQTESKTAPITAASTAGDPVHSPAIVTSPEHGQEAGFAVQVYSFQDRIRADKALIHLKEVGYKAFMEVSDLGEKGIWYRVRIGDLKNEQEARAMLEKIRKEYKSGFIVKPKV